MLKFKYHYLHNTLAYQKNDLWHQLPEEKQFEGQFGSSGFKLDHGWISFTLYETKIRVFYKDQLTPGWVTYYRKDLPLEMPVFFTFTEADEVEKVDGKWTKKGGYYA